MASSQPKDWMTFVNYYANMIYETKKDTIAPAKPADTMGSTLVILIVLACLFTTFVLCVSAVIVWKCLVKGKKGDKQLKPLYEKIGNGGNHADYGLTPKHLTLMRVDSTLSETSRDSSYPPTPLSPLSEEEPADTAFGRLEFTVNYEEDNQRLKATIVQAHGLPQRHCIFYVEGFLLPDKKLLQKTSIRYHNPSPVFEEPFLFGLPYSELSERTLCFRLYELDAFSQETVLGKVLYSFDTGANDYKTAPLKMDLEFSASLPHDNVAHDRIGELLVSLCYLPTSNRLTLVVLKCSLSQNDKTLPDPFLKVSLVLNRKHVKKIKTSVKKKTLNAVYNEAFIFDVPAQHIGNVGLYVRVVNDRAEQEILGRVVIGPQSKTSLGVHHWECMLLSPRKPIAQWHSIMSMRNKPSDDRKSEMHDDHN